MWRGKRFLRAIHNTWLYLAGIYLQDFVFIHINRTGGSSITKALGLYFEHKTALEKRAELGRGRWDKRFTFTFVRNPWDKVVSHYHFRVLTGQTGLGNGSVSFTDWVRLAYRDRDPKYYDHPKMFMSQWEWLADGGGSRLVEFVGRFENLSRDFDEICARINRQATLPHIKATNRGHYRDYYDRETREIVRSVFGDDIQQFGYDY